MFDAYTVKKVLPKLVIAVILIQLSWFIFSGMIFLTESIAYGIEGLIYAPFGEPSDFTFEQLFLSIGGSDLQTLFYTLVTVGAAVVAFGGGIIAFALIAIVALFVGVITLVLRRIMLIMLLLLAPLALVAWILPNTERFWKMWWDNFSKLLLMYPMILAMIAAGRVFAKIGGDYGEESIAVVLVLAGVFLPLALIPKTFKLAGGAFAGISGAISQQRQKASSSVSEKGKEKWGNTRWGLRKQGKKDAKLNTRRQQETAKGVSKAVSSKGLGGIIYRQGLGGKKGAGTAALEASADKALIDSQAEGFIHHGEEYTPQKLRDLAVDESQSSHSRQAALKALAMQGETGALIQASHLLHGQGAAGAKLYNDTLRQNYSTFAGAGAGATHFLDEGKTLQQNADLQLQKYEGASHQELAAMGPRAMHGMSEANLVATGTFDATGKLTAVGDTARTSARHDQVIVAALSNPQVDAALKMRSSGARQTGSIDKWAGPGGERNS